MKKIICLALFATLGLYGSASAGILYDGSPGGTPDTQGWFYLYDPIFPPASATQSESGGITTLDSTPVESDSAGYFSSVQPLFYHPGITVLPRTPGYIVEWRVRVASESHSSTDRAGFSVIALSSDKIGVELAFWEDEIWAQTDTPLFTHGEGIAYDTKTLFHTYALAIIDNGYSLTADGVPILSGPLRDYTAHSNPVYNFDSFLFLGDDTSSASALIELTDISLTLLEAGGGIPEPATCLLLGTGLIALFRRR